MHITGRRQGLCSSKSGQAKVLGPAHCCALDNMGVASLIHGCVMPALHCIYDANLACLYALKLKVRVLLVVRFTEKCL